MEAGSDDLGASPPPVLLPKHPIFLSYSANEKAFVQELNHALMRVHHFPFFDQNMDSLPVGERFSQVIFEAAKQCRVAVIILSIGYLTSKWPMLELVTFHKSMKAGNPMKLLPIFYKITPSDLNRSSWREDWIKLFSGDEELVLECKNAFQALKGIRGLFSEKYENNTVKFREDVVLEICRLLPPPLPFDTSDIQGCDRLCKKISELFKEDKGIHYLGMYGDRGSGKSKLCQAMCNYYYDEYWGKFCIVELEVEKATDSRAATKKREERLRSAIKQLVGLNKHMSHINSEAQGRKYLKDRLPNQRPVFLVLENVSQNNIEEAKFYVNAGYARGSRVLVTSRTKMVLESVFRGQQYSDFCRPVPVLIAEEAALLVLTRAAPNKEITELDENEYEVVDDCCNRCFIDKQYHPSSLFALANYLRTIGDDIIAWKPQLESESFRESNESDSMYRYALLDYDNLSISTKLIFLDLVLFSDGMCHTHLDFHPESEWDGHNNFKNMITYIVYLNNSSPKQAQTKVKYLQGTSFLKESTTEIAVPDFYKEFARWLMRMEDDDRDEKKMYVLCGPDEEATGDGSVKWPEVSAKSVSRVSLLYVSVVDRDLQKLQQFTKLVYLELIKVANMSTLDLQCFISLRVMRVQECEELKDIICTCNSSSNADSFCPSECLHNLRVVQLADLPSLTTASFLSHCSNLETLWFFECSNLSPLPNLQFCKKLKRLRLPCGDFRGFQGLSSNVALTELAFHWDCGTVRNFSEDMSRQLLQDMMNLTNLTVLDIVDERNVYEWVPLGIVMNVGRLVRLTFLDLSCATTITEIEGLQELRHLTALGLYGCCELLKLPDFAIFVKLKRLCIGHCHKLAETLLEDDLVRYKEFHTVGDYCSFGEHECLCPSNKNGICKACCPEDWAEIKGDQDWDKRYDEFLGRGNLLQAPQPMQETYPQQILQLEEATSIEGPSDVRPRKDDDENIVLVPHLASFPEHVPVFWKQLIEECWRRDPEQRPSFAWIRRKIRNELIPVETTDEISEILREFLPDLRFDSRWTAVWQKLASYDSRIDVQKWCRAFIEISSLSGIPACGNSEIIDRQTAVDAIREMAAVMNKNPELVQFIQSQQWDWNIISWDQNSMERFRKRVVICSTQSDFLITKIQRLSSKILDTILGALIFKSRDLQYQEYEAAYALLDRFMCIVVAAEDLLDLCAKQDSKLAALSVFIPASCAPCHSKFALVARDLDYTYHMLLSLLEVETAQNYTLMDTTITDASNQDRSDVLPKLEGELSKGLGHRDLYYSLLMRRFQADASPSASVPVPVCFWIPGEVQYSYLRTVASGNFKAVLKCRWLGLDVAIASYTGEYAKNDLEAEAGILASVQHPNVVSMFGCAYDEKKKEGYLVTELMELDLRHLISERGKSRGDGEMPFSESVARDIILQIVEAMIHVHKCRVLHRDLKPSNCVVSAKKRILQIDWGPETYYVVKLIDFGSAKVRGAYASTCHTRKQGTLAYMAPELHADEEKCAYKWSADVYSLGMTMYEIFSGKSPFEGVYRGGELVRRVCAGERPSLPEYVPVFWQQLMEKCWHRDPEQRPTFAWIRLEILRGITSAAWDPVSAWHRIVFMPLEIREEFLENSEGFLVNPSLFNRIKSSSIGAWNRMKSSIF